MTNVVCLCAFLFLDNRRVLFFSGQSGGPEKSRVEKYGG